MAITRPSVHWAGLNGIHPSNLITRNQIQDIIGKLDFQQLEQVALRTRARADSANTPDPCLSCTIDPSVFTNGGWNVIFEVLFSDGVCWIAKIQHVPIRRIEARENAVNMQSEIATMRVIRDRTRIPVPQVFAFDGSLNNEVGYPYMLLECLPGRILDHGIAQAPPEHHPKIAEQFAEIFFQLQSLSFDKLGRIWAGESCDDQPHIIPATIEQTSSPGTSLEWFYTRRQEENKQALRDHPDDPDWRTACWVLKTALPHMVVDAAVHGPFPLCHVDLHHGNLLFDENFNLTGVIDWSQAQTVPVERLVICPDFMPFPGETNETLSPERRKKLSETNKKIENLRSLVREHLQNLEREAASSGRASAVRLSNIFGSKRADIVHRSDYSNAFRLLAIGRLVARMIFGEDVKWEELVRVHGQEDLG